MNDIKVAFFSPVWARKGPLQLGWSDYWRLALPAVELHRQGWDVVLGREVGFGGGGRLAVKDPDGHWWKDRDVLVFHRWMTDHSPRLIREARVAGQILINDVDDLLWNMPVGHTGHKWFERPDFNVNNWQAGLRESSLLLASTSYLANALEDVEVPVRTIRNYIDISAWEPKKPGKYVGWVGATAGRIEDLEILRPVAAYLNERGESLYHGGKIPGEPLLEEILSHPVITRPYQMPTNYPPLWDPLKIALCPLGNHPFSQAKSWVKTLEACARGIPFIASEHPEYRELGVGRIAATSEQWVWQLKALQDPTVYTADCIINRHRAEELTIARNIGEWEQLLKEAVAPIEERTVAV